MATTDPHDRPLDTSEAAEILGVPTSAIYGWQHRRKVIPVAFRKGRGRGGQAPLWRLSELEPLAEAYRKRRRHAASDGS